MAKKESIAKLTAKHAARVHGKRMATSIFGNGILGKIAGTVVSAAVTEAGKYEINHDKDFGTTSIEKS